MMMALSSAFFLLVFDALEKTTLPSSRVGSGVLSSRSFTYIKHSGYFWILDFERGRVFHDLQSFKPPRMASAVPL